MGQFQLTGHTVGYDLQPGRDGDPEDVARLVAGMVVDREPGGRDVRLADDGRAVVGVDETGPSIGSGTPS